MLPNHQFSLVKREMKKVLTCFESQADLARTLDVAPQVVSEWLTNRRRIPLYRALQMQDLADEYVDYKKLCPFLK